MATQNHNPASDTEITIDGQEYTLLGALIELNNHFDAGRTDEARRLLQSITLGLLDEGKQITAANVLALEDAPALARSIHDAVSDAMALIDHCDLDEQPGADQALPMIASHALGLSKGLNELCK